MSKLIAIRFSFLTETKTFNVFKINDEKVRFFPKKIYLDKEITGDCKKITLNIKAEE